jgi:3-deoxy-D-manno-octulosonic-acid transferase
MMKQVLSCIDLSLMQSVHDAKRIGQLGGTPDTVHVTGNMKFDQGLDQRKPTDDHTFLSATLKLDAAEVLIVAGSTHPQEEECLLEAYREVIARHPQVVLLMAPRHIERASKLEQVIRHYGFTCIRRSQSFRDFGDYAQQNGPRVILLDSRGELPFIYRKGFVTFVGGTLVPVGGHNLLEPAQWGRPVMFGPYVDHCRDIAGLLLESGGGIQIQNQGELAFHLIRLITHPSEAEDMGRRAFQVVQTHRGVIARNLQWIDRLLEKKDSASLSLSVAGSSSITSQEILR